MKNEILLLQNPCNLGVTCTCQSSENIFGSGVNQPPSVTLEEELCVSVNALNAAV